ncbi:MAG: flagellar biosynthetic protein FliQ [Gemmatimonadetes bacterium]|nr:MAG: flagellar biosynthetic protein FliQ [Gemmatimonadota bacterium]
MPLTLVLDLARDALTMALALAGPLLTTALVVGLVVSVLQAVTSIQEQTLSFVPKLFAVGAVFLVLLSWMFQTMVKYTTDLFRSLPGLVG